MPSRITLAVTASCRRRWCGGGGRETKVTPLLVRWVRGYRGVRTLGAGAETRTIYSTTIRFTPECGVVYDTHSWSSSLVTTAHSGRVGKKRKNLETRCLSRTHTHERARAHSKERGQKCVFDGMCLCCYTSGVLPSFTRKKRWKNVGGKKKRYERTA